MGINYRRRLGFTIVELAVTIAVIGILASISVVGYGAWQKRTAENVVKSDLVNAASAMENARNFGNSYPFSVPATFKPSDKVALVGGRVNTNNYCIQASSSSDPSVMMYVTNSTTTPTSGNCSEASGLVAWFPLNGNANDMSGNAKHGAINNASTTTGKDGMANGAYSFNGTSSYIAIPTISIPTAVTTSAWVYSANFAHNGFIVGKNPVNAQWEIFFEGASMRWRGGAPYNNNTMCSVPTSNAWHHVVGVQSGSTTALYIDGVQCDADSGSTAIGNGTDTIEIGRFTTGYYFNGVIDDVRLYNRGLTAAEVQALFASGAQ